MSKGPFLDPATAGDLHRLEPNYIFMSPADLAQECQDVRQSWREVEFGFSRFRSRAEYVTLAAALAEFLPATKPARGPQLHASSRKALQLLPPTQVPLLQQRLRQIEDRLGSLSRVMRSPHYGPCCTLAVSPLWSRRMADMVSGYLHPAWVATLLLDDN